MSRIRRCFALLPLSLLLLAAASPRGTASDSALPPTTPEEESAMRPGDGSFEAYQPDARRPRIDPGKLDSWRKKLDQARQDLAAGELEGVLKKTAKLRAEMLRFERDPQPRLPALAAEALLLKALAEQQQKGREGGRWVALYDLHAAIELDPAVAGLDLATVYGERGRTLAAALAAEKEENAKNLDGGRGRMVPPRQLEDLRSDKMAALGAGLPERLEVEVLVDLAGLPREPRLVEPQHPLIALALLESVRDARFRPASFEGKPVMVHWRLWLAKGQ